MLSELVALAAARRLAREVTPGFINGLTDDPAIEVFWVEREDHQQAMDFLRSRPDKDYSLCDAISFLLMRQRGVTEGFTSDHHFEQEGFVRLLTGEPGT